MKKNPKWTKEQVQKAVDNSISYTEVIDILDASNFRIIKEYIKYYNISTSHFTHHNRNQKFVLSEALIKNSKATRGTVKEHLLKEGYFSYECDSCGISNWN